MPLSVDKPGTPLHKFSGFTASFWQCHPESRGTVNIGSTDPMKDPIIKPNYLSTERDRKTMIEGVKMLRDIINQPAFKHLWNSEMVPGPGYKSDKEILNAIRNMGSTVFHPVGTCRMGNDANAVLDSQLKVNGVKNLRVIDASAMPKITSANTNAPTYLIGEKGADMICVFFSPFSKDGFCSFISFNLDLTSSNFLTIIISSALLIVFSTKADVSLIKCS